MSESFDFRVMDDSASDSDLLKDGTHQRIADRLFDLITKSDAKGLTIGLEGSWGSGKSTVVNLLRKKLEKTKETFVFYMDSWAHEGDFLRRAFLERFAQQLQECSEEDDSSIKKIKDEISNKVVTKTTCTEPVITWFAKLCAFLLVFFVPAGFLFVDHGLDKSSLECKCFIVIGLLLIFSPVLCALLVCLKNLWNQKREKRKSCLKGKNEENNENECANEKNDEENDENEKDSHKTLMPVFWTTDTTETVTNETTKEPEKTSLEFENFFEQLLEKTYTKGFINVVCVIDNLDRINPEDALKIWSTLQIFVESKNLKKCKSRKSDVWVVVPYDESGLRLLWDKKDRSQTECEKEGLPNGSDDSKETDKKKNVLCSKSFFDKSFQLRIEVPKMLFEGWENYADKIIHDSLENSFSEEQMSCVLEMLKRGRVSISDAPSPREIKTYVNQVGFLYPLHKENASLESLCFYVDLKYLKSKSADDIKEGLRNRRIWTENKVLGFVKEKTDVEKELCAILFNVNGEKGMELLIEDPVRNALNEGNESELQKLVRNHEHAVKIFVENILAENKYDCKNYMHLLMKTFEGKLEDDLLRFVVRNCDQICNQMDKIASVDDLCAIFQIVKESSENDSLYQLSKKYVAMQHELLKGDEDKSTVEKVVDSIERVYDIVDDPDLIYIDYRQLGMKHFQQVADAVGIERSSKFGKFVRNIDSLDEDYSQKIVPNSPELALLPKFPIILACSSGCLQWNKTLQAINKLIVFRPQNNVLNTDAFVQCVEVLSALQGYELKEECDAIKSLLNRPDFWHYVSVSQKECVKLRAAYLLAKYTDDLISPQVQFTGQSLNGYNSTKAVFKEKNDDIVSYFCKKINATKKSDFIWSLAKNHTYQLIGGIIEKQLKDEKHWFFNTDKPFECFANAIEYEYPDNERVRVRLLTEFEKTAQLISCVQKDEAPVTTHLSACKLLLESDYSRAVVEKVKHELAAKTKDVWSNALNDNTELLDIVRRCKELEGQSLEELSNNFADAFKEYVKLAMSAENADCLTTEDLAGLYDCMSDSFKRYVSGEVVNEIIVRNFVVHPQIRDFLVTKLDYDVLIGKHLDAEKIIKDLVEDAKWSQLEFVVALIDKLDKRFVPKVYDANVMIKLLKTLKGKAEQGQLKIVETLCKFFNVDFNSLENVSDEDGGEES